jgi:hypothetical protein
MSNQQDDKLDEMLRTRRLPGASPDLAQRILLAAQGTPQIQALTLGQWIKRAFAELHLPKPAYVLTGALIAGLLLGFNVPSDTAHQDTDAVQVQAFLDSDEDLL